MRAGAAGLLLLTLLAVPAKAWPRKSDKSPEAELSRWIKQRGGRLVRHQPGCSHCNPAFGLCIVCFL